VTRRSFRGAWLSLLALSLALAGPGRADEPKTYRWVSEDGHVYTSTTPPPDGKGIIEVTPVPAAKATAPALEPAAEPDSAAQSSALRRFLAGAAEGRRTAAPAPASAGGDELDCSRYQIYVDDWRIATRSLEAAQQNLESLQSDTDTYVRRNDSSYERQIDWAETRIRQAEDRLHQVESDASRANVPQSCFTE
jgi:hypothetical protein